MHLLLIPTTSLAILVSIATATQPITIATRALTSYRNVAYFPNWAIYARNFQPQNLRADALTHVIYAFANIRPDTGEVYLSDTWSDTEKHYPTDSWNESGHSVYGCVKQLFLLKKRNRKMKTLLSVGGWTYSENFAQPSSTAEGRFNFARSSVQLIKDLGFDGLDIDWEFPQNDAQAKNLVDLLAETRKQLDAYSAQHASGEHLLLTVAAPAGPTNYNTLKLAAMDKYLDFWNLMTYDYGVSKNHTASHNANWNTSSENPNSTPFNSHQTIEYYIKAGVPADKLVIGMPLFGRSFANTDGPGSSFSGVGKGTWEPGIYDYKDLPLPGAEVKTDHVAAASWSYDSSQRIMISFDTPSITVTKTKYIKVRGLGGAMWWESSGDKMGNDSLISAFVQEIGGIKALDQSYNLLQYPASIYQNIKAGIPRD